MYEGGGSPVNSICDLSLLVDEVSPLSLSRWKVFSPDDEFEWGKE
jgi:hypothetical protein